MKPVAITQLSLMMLFQYFIWGSWYVSMNTYMKVSIGASDVNIGAAYSGFAIATMISPVFVGMVADRFFAAQKLMGLLHIAGAAVLYTATLISDPGIFPWIIIAYSLLYMPTIALSNSIAFAQMADPGKQFPWIRVFGTVGWIVAGLMVTALDVEKTAFIFHMAAIASLLLGLFSFSLPDTPPKGAGKRTSVFSAIGLDALVLFKNRAYLIFFIAAILVCIPLSFYYTYANLFLNDVGMEGAAGKMTLGQVSEAVFILAIPFMFNRVGVKNMILIGMMAWLLRYLCFAYGNIDNAWMLYAGIILHGICYDFFFVTGYMYTEKKASEKIKSAAQGLFTFATYGLGMVIGSWISGQVAENYSKNGIYDWTSIWYVPAGIAVLVLVYFILFFKEKRDIQQVA